jgi:hypothetical protein
LVSSRLNAQLRETTQWREKIFAKQNGLLRIPLLSTSPQSFSASIVFPRLSRTAFDLAHAGNSHRGTLPNACACRTRQLTIVLVAVVLPLQTFKYLKRLSEHLV